MTELNIINLWQSDNNNAGQVYYVEQILIPFPFISVCVFVYLYIRGSLISNYGIRYCIYGINI